MGRHLNYSGFVIAGIGFFLTRFTVTLAIYEDPMRFYLAGVVPLALGLGLAAFGVVLAVVDIDPAVVRTTAAWCVVGTAAMTVLAVLTVSGNAGQLTLDAMTVRSESHLSTFLIGGRSAGRSPASTPLGTGASGGNSADRPIDWGCSITCSVTRSSTH